MFAQQKICHPGITDNLNILFDLSTIEEIKSIATKRNEGVRFSNIRGLVNQIDNEIGGNNIFDLICHQYTTKDSLGNESLAYTGQYHSEDRAIFRPLQYAMVCLETSRPNLQRYSINMSCVHVEAVLKRKLSGLIKGADHLPLGNMVLQVKSKRLNQVLDGPMINILENTNFVYNISKHDCSFERIPPEEYNNPDPSIFNNLEAICMFFICRKIGLMLDPSIASSERYDLGRM